MKHKLLSEEELLAGYDAVNQLYPYIPSLLLWRSWEYAAYQRYALIEPVLDVGCGDGRWFRLVWPEITDVYGIELEPAVVERAAQSGVYRKVWQADAASMSVEAGAFGTVFANCSLEHMDNIHTVMSNVWQALRPGGLFIFSIVTDKINDWFSQATLARALGEEARAQGLYEAWLGYHHLVNPFTIQEWCAGLADSGFEVVEHIPIIPEMTGRLFLLLDSLWHTKQGQGEVGDQLYPYIQQVPHFPAAFRGILQSVLMMESDPQIGCGAVLVAKKVERAGQMVEHPERICWCGSNQLSTFSADYLFCAACGTLVSQTEQSANPPIAHNDSSDYYGKEYWLSHQQQNLGLPDIYARARADLPERCLYWLRTLLTYKLPPATVLELGSSHGGFVAQLRWAGFDATGLELSPWVVDFARQTFDVPMLLGAIEQQQLPEQSFDVIVLNDVLEHLPDPLSTLRRCVELLKPDGIMLIQTPSYPDPQTYKDLVHGENRFIEMLEAKEHLYLFSQRAVQQLFERLGYGTLHFMPALFQYDMYFVASKQALTTYTSDAITQTLAASPSGRMIQALIDKATEVEQLRTQVAKTAGLEADVTYLKGQISTIETSQRTQLEQFNAQIAASEADRAARLQIIEQQAVAIEQQASEIGARLVASEADRSARLEVIERQGAELGRIPALEADIDYLKARLIASDNDRAAQAAMLERVRTLFGAKNPRAYIRMLSPARWGKIWKALQMPSSAINTVVPAATPDAKPEQPGHYALNAYITEINEFNSAQSNAGLLDRIRKYNHSMIETFHQMRSFQGKRLLDIGASPHGYALERALALGVAEYIGIGLDVDEQVEVHSANSHGKLLYMNAEQLELPAQSFDLVISLSTFEHVSDVASVLSEIKRVLKPGGSALITFEPIWTCSYGHHLHHFGPVSANMPDWAHLLWDKEQMRAELASTWPADGAISLDEAVEWTFESPVINRISITQMREYFAQSGLEIEWMVPIPDEKRDPKRLKVVTTATSLSADDLMAKGLSVLLNKVEGAA